MPYLLTSNPGSPSSWVRTEAAAAGDNSSGSNNSHNGHDSSSISAMAAPSATPPITGSISRRPRLPPVPPSALTSSTITANAGTSTLPSSKYSNYMNSALASSASFGPFSQAMTPPPSMLSPAMPPMPPPSSSSGYGIGYGAKSSNFSHMNLSFANRNNGILSTANSPSPHHISLFAGGGNVALQNGASSVGNLYNNPIAAEAPYMQQQSSGVGRVAMDGYGGISSRQIEEPPIVPNHHQEHDWGETTTAVTGLSDLAFPPMHTEEDVSSSGRVGANSSKWWNNSDSGNGDSSGSSGPDSYVDSWRFRFQRHAGPLVTAAVSILAFLSPIAMVAIPRTNLIDLTERQLRCEVECDGLLISFGFKLCILLAGTWAVFARQPRATLPRIHLFRSLVTSVAAVLTFSFWLFYSVKVVAGEERRRVTYHDIVQFADSLASALVFVHYLAVLLVEIKHGSPQFYIKVIRSPDGESRSYSIGNLSIQRAASHVLDKYYTDFPIFNPYLERIRSESAGVGKGAARRNGIAVAGSYKYFDAETEKASSSPFLTSASPRLGGRDKRESSQLYANYAQSNYYQLDPESLDYDRRVRKRRARLLAATEEAFEGVRRVNDVGGKTPTAAAAAPMDAYDAAQSVLPEIARPLQKYLRITRQQPRHTTDSVLAHLATCLRFDLAPRAFLERYFVPSPVLQSDRERRVPVQTWALICDSLLSRSLKPGTVFQLRQNGSGTADDVSLLCQVSALPHYNITEEIIERGGDRFVIRDNSETPV